MRPVVAARAGERRHLPARDEEYDRARTTWALAVDLRPAAVAFPNSAGEAVVRAARLRIAPLGTRHNAYPLGDLTDSVLMRMSGMTGSRLTPMPAGPGSRSAPCGCPW